jgi:hypothetical protein
MECDDLVPVKKNLPLFLLNVSSRVSTYYFPRTNACDFSVVTFLQAFQTKRYSFVLPHACPYSALLFLNNLATLVTAGKILLSSITFFNLPSLSFPLYQI